VCVDRDILKKFLDFGVKDYLDARESRNRRNIAKKNYRKSEVHGSIRSTARSWVRVLSLSNFWTKKHRSIDSKENCLCLPKYL